MPWRMASPRAAAPRLWAVASATAAALTTTSYVIVITHQGDDPFWDVLPWFVLMSIGTFAAMVPALVTDPKLRLLSSIVAAVLLGCVGVAAILSIGAGFILAALLAAVVAASVAAQPAP